MTQTPVPSPPARKLPVLQVVAEGYSSFFYYLRYLPQAAFLPVLLTLPLQWMMLNNLKRMLPNQQTPSEPPLTFLLMNIGANFVVLLILTLFYLSWFRLTLLGPEAGRPPWIPLPRRRHLCFLWKGFLLVLICLGTGFVVLLSFILVSITFEVVDTSYSLAYAIATSLVPSLVIFYVILRFAFVFPAVAVDEPYGLRNAWAHTKGQTLRLLAVLLLTGLPLYLLLVAATYLLSPELLGALDPQAPPDPAALIEGLERSWLVSMLVGLPLGFCTMAVVIGTFSAAFRITTGWYPEDPTTGLPDHPSS